VIASYYLDIQANDMNRELRMSADLAGRSERWLDRFITLASKGISFRDGSRMSPVERLGLRLDALLMDARLLLRWSLGGYRLVA
jgi:hypothetical protein